MSTGVRLLGLGLLLGLGVLAACGTSPEPAASSAPSLAAAGGTRAGVPKEPSESARMICAKDEQDEIAHPVGLPRNGRPVASWVVPVYTCTYPFKGGRLVLSVRELTTPADTVAYFNGTRTAAGASVDVPGLGDAAFETGDGSVWVRKDAKVLHVDVTGLPQGIGQPPISRATVAEGVASVIMGCWTGA